MDGTSSESRRSRILKRYGSLPPNWGKLTNDEVAVWGKRRRLRKKGYLSIAQMLRTLGLSQSAHTRNSLTDWLHDNNWRFEEIRVTRDIEIYYAPITVEVFLSHAKAPALVRALFNRDWPLLSRVIVSPEFKVSLVAHALSS